MNVYVYIFVWFCAVICVCVAKTDTALVVELGHGRSDRNKVVFGGQPTAVFRSNGVLGGPIKPVMSLLTG